MDEEVRRKLQAKRFNEHIKLVTTTLNPIALLIFAGAVLQPLLVAEVVGGQRDVNWPWVVVSTTLHMLAHGVIRLIRPE